jgi:hypothetical protein
MIGAGLAEPGGKLPSHPRRGAVRDAIETARAMLVTPRGGWLDETVSGRRLMLMLADADQAMRALLALRELLDDMRPEHVPRASLTTVAARLDQIADVLQHQKKAKPARRRCARSICPRETLPPALLPTRCNRRSHG